MKKYSLIIIFWIMSLIIHNRMEDSWTIEFFYFSIFQNYLIIN
jgi:hypothetical protein